MLNLQSVLKLEAQEGADGEVPLVMSIQQNMASFYLTNKTKRPTVEEVKEAIVSLTEDTGVALTLSQLQDLLSLYPKVAIDMACNGVSDTETRAALANMISATVLGCAYPTYGDNVDSEEYHKTLHKYARLMGYGVEEQE